MSDGTLPILKDIARPALIWTLHFIFVYGAFSAACADRALVGYGTVPMAVLIATGAAMIGAGWSVFRKGSSALRVSARWSGIISTMAIAFNAAPVLLMNGCG